MAGNVYQLWRSGAVYYITVGSGKRMSRPGEVPHQALRDLATSFVQLLGNGTSAGLAENWADAERYMSDHAREAFARVRAEQLPILEAGNISITTERIHVTSIQVVRQHHYNLYQVELSALQTVRYGAMSMGGVEARFGVSIMPGNRDAVHGLWIADFDWPPLSVPTGKVSRR
jgi:hypothetical protein